MRFIGGKSLLLDRIDDVIRSKVKDRIITVGDLFAGSGVVSRHFKQNGYRVIGNDLMYMSYVLVRGMIELNTPPVFAGLGMDVFAYLNSIEEPLRPDDAFITNNYSPNEKCRRMYFQPRNAKKIDGIRQQIGEWRSGGYINESEYFYLLACLLSAVPYVANITGVYASYLKSWDKRTYKKLSIQPLPVVPGELQSSAHNMDAIYLCRQKSFDLAYIDPPYNQRDYVPNYHVLETIARYDNPEIYGVTGLRPYVKSSFCSRDSARLVFEAMFSSLDTKYAVVSYNNESLLDTDTLLTIFEKYGKVTLFEFPYRRYKSKIPNNTEGLKEQLYFVEFI